MYIEHPYFYEGKYYANIDGEMIEITKEVAYAMNNFYRSSKAKKVEIKNELGEVVDKMLREVPYSGQSIDGEGFMIEDFPDLNCDVEHCVLTKMEQQDIQLCQRLRDRDQTENFQRQVRHLPAGGSSHPEDGSRGQL